MSGSSFKDNKSSSSNSATMTRPKKFERISKGPSVPISTKQHAISVRMIANECESPVKKASHGFLNLY